MESSSINLFISALALQLDADKMPPISVIWSTSKYHGSSGFRMGVHVLGISDSMLHENNQNMEKHVILPATNWFIIDNPAAEDFYVLDTCTAHFRFFRCTRVGESAATLPAP
jgi:hypothetical protein